MNIKQALAHGVEQLQEYSDTARLDAEILLCAVLGCERIFLISHDTDELAGEQQDMYIESLARRVDGEPVAYITGEKEFWGLSFQVSSAVLVPRPETELLIEKALEFATRSSGELQILDLGTGSGCIAITLATELKRAGRAFQIVATDISEAALTVARVNAETHKVADRIEFLCGSWFAPLAERSDRFDLIASNPPYIANGDKYVSRELRFEPAGALYSGPLGIDAYRNLLKELGGFLKPEGIFLGEFGSTQREILEANVSLISDLRFSACYQDLAGLDRVLELTRA